MERDVDIKRNHDFGGRVKLGVKAKEMGGKIFCKPMTHTRGTMIEEEQNICEGQSWFWPNRAV